MGSLMVILDLLVLVSFIAAFLAIRDYQKRGGLPYPPGPRPLPFIGNLFDIPKDFSWLSHTQLSKKHGDVLSYQIFGQVIVVLNTSKATKDLLERRSDIYSDRPAIPIYKMMKWEFLVAFAGYTEYWRLARKLLDRGLRPWAIATYRPLQQMNTHLFLSQLLENPNELEAHLAYLLAELTLRIAYGYEVQGPNDKIISDVQRMVHLASITNLPGSVLVNSLPFLRHIPEWLPWLSYQPLARYGYNLGQEVKHRLMSFVKEGILNGSAQPSLALENLQEMDSENLSGPEREKAEDVVAGALASMFGAATDTTVASLMSFFVAVLLHPNVQKQAQKELDAVTRRRRLPTFEDRPVLPFISAVCKEVLRWRPPVPLAVPHATTKDDVYEGFFIPKGAQVVGNAWAILHDPVMYPEPDCFKPERFLNPDGSLHDDPVLTAAFGFGRRICPGRHFADDTLFIVAASFLSVFNIGKARDTDNGPDAFSYTGTALSHPSAFRYSIVPRDRRAEKLIVADALTR